MSAPSPAISIPLSAELAPLPSLPYQTRLQGLRVAVVRNNKVVLLPISIGHDYGNTVEVTSGLSADDAVVLDPADSLAAGTTVKVVEAGKPGAA